MCRSFNEKGNLKCVALKNIHTPHEGHFCFRPPPPWNFSNFPTWLDTPWNEYFSQKRLCTILLCDIVSGIPREKIFMFTLIQCQII